MAKPPKKTASKKSSSRGLGRGLSALMSDVAPAVKDGAGSAPEPDPIKVVTTPKSKPATHNKESKDNAKPAALSAAQFINIQFLERNPAQPRRYFDPAKLDDLMRSVREKGVLQPILARPIPQKGIGPQRYQIVAGERRYQAALKAGLGQMPVMIRELSDQEVLEIGVVENVQRANLNPIEEAMAYRNLVDEFGRKQDDIAKAVGKSRSHVANMMRLLTLPERAQDLLAQGKLSAGHARAVISAPDPAALAEMIVHQDLSVRNAEAMVRKLKKGEPLRPPAQTKDADTRAVEKLLSDSLGMDVQIKHKNPAGQVVIRYKSADQLEDLIKRLPKGFE